MLIHYYAIIDMMLIDVIWSFLFVKFDEDATHVVHAVLVAAVLGNKAI